MRRLLLILALLLALPAAAQRSGAPAGLQPIPEPPPPPQDMSLDPALEPQVTITKRGDDRVEEFRVNGKLYMIKVTPPHGTPYYLIDEKGDGRMSRQASLDTGLRVPMWVIGTFWAALHV
ncbi:MAG: DUF2782 domain-containing protein [Sterolibacterium sp.]